MNPMILIFLGILMIIAAGQLVASLRAPSRYDIQDKNKQ